jgi:hypothetical protein
MDYSATWVHVYMSSYRSCSIPLRNLSVRTGMTDNMPTSKRTRRRALPLGRSIHLSSISMLYFLIYAGQSFIFNFYVVLSNLL